MTVIIVQKRSQSFAVKVGIAAILTLTVIGLSVRFLKSGRHAEESGANMRPVSGLNTISDSLLVPVIELDVADPTLEKNWINALAEKLDGQSEVTVPYGRVDVITGSYAIEVDYLHKFKEGIGQALHYGEVKGITPGLALIYERSESETDADVLDKLRHIEALCSTKGIRLFLLKRK